MSSRERSLAWWLAVGALVAHTVAAVHFTVLDHVQCTEHGQWIEVAPAPAGSSVEMNRQSALPTSCGAHHHDHCLVAAAGAARLVMQSRNRVPVHATELRSARARELACADHRKLILLIAPKASPPV